MHPSTAELVELNINGQAHELTLEPRVSLLDALRDELHLNGTKKGCAQGACGACTVLVDGERINACLALAVQMQGRRIVTVEGLAEGGQLHPLQRASSTATGSNAAIAPPGSCAPRSG